LKGFIATLVLGLGLLGAFVGQATAAGETASVSSEVSPVSEGFYETVARAAKLTVHASVEPAQDATHTRVIAGLSIRLPETVRLGILPGLCPQASAANAADYSGELIPNGLPDDPIPALEEECGEAIAGDGLATLHPSGDLGEGSELKADLLVLRTGIDAETLAPIFVIVGDIRGDAPFAGFWLRAEQENDGDLVVAMRDVKSIGMTGLSLGFPGDRGESLSTYEANCPGTELVTSGEILVGDVGDDSDSDDLTSPTMTQPCDGAPDPTRTVRVIKTGTGTGTVSGTGGLSCGDICQVTIKGDEYFSVSAVAAPGSEFAGFTGCDFGFHGSCYVVGSHNVTARFDLVGPLPPSGPVGVTVNNGARYTNDPIVELSVIWPYPAMLMRISNAGASSSPGVFGVTRFIPWTLDPIGPESRPKKVEVRFDESGPTYSDDIVLDQTPPRILSLSARRRSSTGEAVVRIKARDRVSGVSKAQIGDRRSSRLPRRRFDPKLRIKRAGPRLWVRVFDRAGNASHWKSARVR